MKKFSPEDVYQNIIGIDSEPAKDCTGADFACECLEEVVHALPALLKSKVYYDNENVYLVMHTEIHALVTIPQLQKTFALCTKDVHNLNTIKKLIGLVNRPKDNK